MTPVIELIQIDDAHKIALKRGRSELESMLRVSLPRRWPQFREAFEPAAAHAPLFVDWPSYFFMNPTGRQVVGNGGFAGPPDANGQVEIGYEIAPRFQNRGYATAAARRLVEIAFARPEVNAVVAHTLSRDNASTSVLKKVGMIYVDEIDDPEAGTLWRWRIARRIDATAGSSFR